MKPRLVMKFGGTSVADIDRIRNVANKVIREIGNGFDVAVVVSAMAGVTNKLVGYVESFGKMYDAREYDAAVCTGERITAGLLALCLQEKGIDARSFSGAQVPIITDGAHGKARIEEIPETNLKACFESGAVAVIAGFQGVNKDTGRETTLGRGGSDTSAVAIAAALRAVRCDIYTDVDGVYTTDPRIVENAKKIDRISYEEMLEYASLGAKVLQTRSVELAMAHSVRVRVLSSLLEEPGEGTLVCNEEEIMEKQLVTGVAYSKDEAKITLLHVADTPGVASDIFGPLAESSVNVDMIVQNVSEDGNSTHMTFTVPKGDAERALNVIESLKSHLKYQRLLTDTKVAKVSVIGVGMRSHAGVAAKMFKALAEKGINIQVISTSEIKVSVLIAAEYTELAVRVLHEAFDLAA